jgi:hypothetical protein
MSTRGDFRAHDTPLSVMKRTDKETGSIRDFRKASSGQRWGGSTTAKSSGVSATILSADVT